jgi:hypothetical protein
MSDDLILSALAACEPNVALEPGDPRFVDLDAIRGQTLRKYLLKLFRAADTKAEFGKVAVAGNRGAGKSTELNRAQKELNNAGYETLWASVNENLDPRDISFSDIVRLMILLIDDRYGHLAEEGTVLKAAFDAAYTWFTNVTKTYTDQITNAKELGLQLGVGGAVGVEATGEAGVGPVAKGGLKFKTDLGKLGSALSVLRRSEGSVRTEIRETLERYNNQLIVYLISLLAAATTTCCPTGGTLVVILDNVDKYEPEIVNQTFLRHAALFQEVSCHLIFTIQSSLLHSPVEDAVEHSFTSFVIPMLPVFETRSRARNEEIMPTLREAVYKRVPKELFVGGDDLVDEFIMSSGGCWRDLLRLLQEALLAAEDVVGSVEFNKARNKAAQTYRRLIADPQDLRILAETRVKKTVLSDKRTRYLLHHLCVLGYNGEGWYDIHPLLDNYGPVVEAILEVQRLRE